MPKYIEGPEVKFTQNDKIFVDVEFYTGEKFKEVELRRMFPITGVTKYIALLDKDGNEITRDEYEELGWENGAEEQMRDVYQYYLINESLAHMLINHTDNLVFYSDKLDLYVLGVTHFGTGWSCVAEDFRW